MAGKGFSSQQQRTLSKIGVEMGETAIEDLKGISESASSSEFEEILLELQKTFLPYWGFIEILRSEVIITSVNTEEILSGGLNNAIIQSYDKLELAFRDFLEENDEFHREFKSKILTRNVTQRAMLSDQFQVEPVYDYWIEKEHELAILQHVGYNIKNDVNCRAKFVAFSAQQTNDLAPIKALQKNQPVPNGDTTPIENQDNTEQQGGVNTQQSVPLNENSESEEEELSITTKDIDKILQPGSEAGAQSAAILKLFLKSQFSTSARMQKAVEDLKDAYMVGINNNQTQAVNCSPSHMENLLQMSHLDKFMLTGKDQFDGSPKNALKFVRHMLETVFPKVPDDLNRIHILKMSMTEKMQKQNLTALSSFNDKACEEIVIEILDRYSDRVTAAEDLLQEFLSDHFPFPVDAERKEQFMVGFIKDLENLQKTLKLYGMTNMVDNFFFYKELKKIIPVPMLRKWLGRVKEKDFYQKSVFRYERTAKALKYKVKKIDLTAGGRELESVQFFSYPAAQSATKHEIKFELKLFVNWLKHYWLKRETLEPESYSVKAHTNFQDTRRREDDDDHENQGAQGGCRSCSCCAIQSSTYKGNKKNNRSSGNNQHTNQGKSKKQAVHNETVDQFRQNPNRVRYVIKLFKDGKIHMPKATEKFKQHKQSMFEVDTFMQLSPIFRLAFLLSHKGCLKCGYKHVTGTCTKTQIQGWPCSKEHKNKSACKWHNEKVHDDKYHEFRNKGLFRLVKPIGYCNAHTNWEETTDSEDECLLMIDCQDEAGNFWDAIDGITHSAEDVRVIDRGEPVFAEGESLRDYESMTYTRSDFLYGNSCVMTSCTAYNALDLDICHSPKAKNKTEVEVYRPVVNSYRKFAYVKVRSNTGSITQSLIVMIDSGADKSFIDTHLQKMCTIPGVRSSMLMGGINGVKQYSIELCSFTIVVPKTKRELKVDNFISLDIKRESLIPVDTIPSKEIVNATPGLEDTEWPHKPVCHMILGTDFLSLIEGSDTVIRDTPIGTVIGGKLGIEDLHPKSRSHIDTLHAFSQDTNVTNEVYEVPAKRHDPNEVFALGSDPFDWENCVNPCHLPQPTSKLFSCSLVHTQVQHDTRELIKRSQESEKSIDYFRDRNLYSLKQPIEYILNGDNRQVNTAFISEQEIVKDTKAESTGTHTEKPKKGAEAKVNCLGITTTAVQEAAHSRKQTVDSQKILATQFSTPAWQKDIVIPSHLPVDMQQLFVRDYLQEDSDLLQHSYLDQKGWSVEQRYTFSQMVSKAIKEEGRWSIPMITNSKIKLLANPEYTRRNKAYALSVLRSNDKKQKSKPAYSKEVMKYFNYMSENEIIEDIPQEDIRCEQCYYLAWFSVETGSGPDGQGKFRIVMDASGAVDGVSLNTCLTEPPEITSSIFNSAFAFRNQKYVITADIKKMFFQFVIPKAQRNLLRILVHQDWDPDKPIVEKRFCRDAFGVKQAGLIASLGVKLTARDNISKASIYTLNAVNQDMYMDDFSATADTPQLAAKIGLEAHALGQTANFAFCKYDSNSFEVLKHIPKELKTENPGPVANAKLVELGGSPQNNQELIASGQTKLLGTVWDKTTDRVSLKINVKEYVKVTKRLALSQCASVYDIFGIAAPVTLVMKLLIQRMHREGFDWDVEVSDPIKKKWQKWFVELPELANISIQRACHRYQNPKYTDLHVHCDASEEAYGMVIYIVTYYEELVDPVFGLGRSVVKPEKCLANVQRLELQGMAYTCEKVIELTRVLKTKVRNVYFWSDSQYSLSLVTNLNTKLSVYEFNRVQKIQLIARNFVWLHIPGELNPADVFSRGVNPKDYLANFRHILEGPQNLHTSEPLMLKVLNKRKITKAEGGTPQQEVGAATASPFVWGSSLGSIISNMATLAVPKELDRLADFTNKKVTKEQQHGLKTFTEKVRKEMQRGSKLYLDVLNLLKADLQQDWHTFINTVAKFLHHRYFGTSNIELPQKFIEVVEGTVWLAAQLLSWDRLVDKIRYSHVSPVTKDQRENWKSLSRCSAHFSQEQGCVVCYGRLASVDASFVDVDSSPKIVLPHNNPFTEKLIMSIHIDLAHLGQNAVISKLNDKYWLIQAHRYVKNVISKCLPCQAQLAKTLTPQMAALPKIRRTALIEPFSHVGIDVAGHFFIRSSRAKHYPRKIWVLIISCLTTRACHLLTLDRMTGEEFVTVFDTFNQTMNRVVVQVYCDRGSNFILGDKMLNNQECEDYITDFEGLGKLLLGCKGFEQFAVKSGIQFTFGKPRTPHAQGYVEIMVKCLKTALGRVIGPFSEYKNIADLSHSSFQNVLANIQYGLNKRPLTTVSDSNNDINFISPSSFLRAPIYRTVHGAEKCKYVDQLGGLGFDISDSQRLCNKYTKQLWEIWSSLYIPSILERNKWYKDKEKALQVGDMVLYKTGKQFGKDWPIGKATKIHKSRDGIARHIDIKTKKGQNMTVPLHDCCHLEGLDSYE